MEPTQRTLFHGAELKKRGEPSDANRTKKGKDVEAEICDGSSAPLRCLHSIG
jgi:hypothetical protein